MRSSKNGGLDIDDLPIPTADEGPKTFEQLLEEKLEAAAALGSASKQVAGDAVPKKQFLKRKQPTYVPPSRPQTKQYRYYSDAVTQSKDGESTEQPTDTATRSSRRMG